MSEPSKGLQYKRLWKSSGRCCNCGSATVTRAFKCSKCLSQAAAKQKRASRRLRDAAFEAYGGAHCADCDEREPHFLTIEHTHGGGSIHLRSMRERGIGGGLYWWLRHNRYPDGFEVLCMNCNIARHRKMLQSTIDSQSQDDGRSRRREVARNYARRLRVAAVEAYGGRCECCAETRPHLLTLDHVNGRGNEHRRQLKFGPPGLALWLRRQGYPTGFQVLCYNCNLGRWRNGGSCPHQSKATSCQSP
jgi:hypothetical protein